MNAVTQCLENDVLFLEQEQNVIKMPFILSKYIKEHTRVSGALKRKERDLESFFSKRYKYYKEDYDDMVLKDREVGLYVKNEEEYQKLQSEVDELTVDKEEIERCISTLKDFQWLHRAKIDYEKLYSVRGDES